MVATLPKLVPSEHKVQVVLLKAMLLVVAVNMDTKTVEWFKNGVSHGFRIHHHHLLGIVI